MKFYFDEKLSSKIFIIIFNFFILLVLLVMILKPDPSASLIAVYKPNIDPVLSIMKIGGYPLRYGRWNNVVVYRSDDPDIIYKTLNSGALIVFNAGSAEGCFDPTAPRPNLKNLRLNESFN